MTTTSSTVSSEKAVRWTVDASHSHVGFTVRHMMITNVRGEFGAIEGTVAYDPQRPEAATIKAAVDVASINTHEEKRDAHLRSADFFDVEHHPKMTFESRRIGKKGDALEVHGDLTIRGVTRPIVLTVEDVTSEQKDPWGQTRIGASAKGKIRRSEFGIMWNAALEAGGVLVSDDVTIHIEASLVKQAG